MFTRFWPIERLAPFMMIYTSENMDNGDRIDWNTEPAEFVNRLNQLLNVNIEVSVLEVTFITHGFNSDTDYTNIPEMKNAILNRPMPPNYEPGERDRAVVLVDWRIGAKRVYIHGIGHSLGAHLMGKTGKIGNGLSGNTIFDRITGLDPPCIAITRLIRLHESDALMVDAIHTTAVQGSVHRSFGTVDFFPNHGCLQPGLFLGAGGHARVKDLFLWSILNPAAFSTTKRYLKKANGRIGTEFERQNEAVQMGFYCGKEATGSWYIRTNDREPWSVDD